MDAACLFQAGHGRQTARCCACANRVKPFKHLVSIQLYSQLVKFTTIVQDLLGTSWFLCNYGVKTSLYVIC